MRLFISGCYLCYDKDVVTIMQQSLSYYSDKCAYVQLKSSLIRRCYGISGVAEDIGQQVNLLPLLYDNVKFSSPPNQKKNPTLKILFFSFFFFWFFGGGGGGGVSSFSTSWQLL